MSTEPVAETPFNPLDKRNLARSVAEALLRRPVCPLPSPYSRGKQRASEAFSGAGIYAIYYVGAYEHYAAVAAKNREDRWEWPIYVGKAVPKGARKGGFGLEAATGTVLYDRLREHARSIEQAENLALADFCCRYLVVDDIWILLGEALLIETFMPIWNKVIDGFGIHDPGSGRAGQQRSRWDVLHPGRPFAMRLQGSVRSGEEIIRNLRRYLAGEDAEIVEEDTGGG
jgi:hypothetical protein